MNKIVERGVVKWYDELKGFGFITHSKGHEVFVHRSGLYSSFLGLFPGDEVEFSLKKGRNGLQAVDVRTVKEYKALG